MPSHAQDWRNRAALARSFGDMPTADWCDEQADHHDGLAASIARLEARDVLRVAAAEAERWKGALDLLGRDHA